MGSASCLPEAEYRQDACSTLDAGQDTGKMPVSHLMPLEIETGKMPVPRCICVPDSRFPIPDSRFPIPDSRFPIPCSLFPSANNKTQVPAEIHPVSR
ncbi:MULTISPECIES: hypothetical protein [unclassified Moorena]|uniref:hypothetical protein n=1 Tax=unclassified Moorena TaxID=2683338 RepID=UPI0014001608|nr:MULTISPECIES: hypothetical protein [unclassified Moorena]NEO10985.1 hypothetical protein [Moorena sp. SIO3E8]NEP99099.1 hypothetical protein [Moorena sp. SIO3F7]